MDPIARMVAAGAAGAAGGGDPTYVDDVFSTFLYVGNSGTQSISNGIDLSGEGGLVWIKNRSTSNTYHALFDTERGTERYLYTNGNGAEYYYANNGVTSFNSNGFTVKGTSDWWGLSGEDICSWTFRKAPGFFDVQTWAGNGVAGRTISHDLGSTPGMIILKKISSGGINRNWWCWHRSISSTPIILNQEAAAGNYSGIFGSVSSTSFAIGSDENTNASGHTYVAYIFAHDDQSFGTNSDESIIKCGSYTGTGSSGNTVNLGFEPQFLLIKQTNTSRNWYLADNMRGIATGQYTAYLQPNINHAETDGAGPTIALHATGFELTNHSALVNESSGSYVYMAIRRPHKPPTAGTEVFKPVTRTGTESAGFITGVGFAPDFLWNKERTSQSLSLIHI